MTGASSPTTGGSCRQRGASKISYGASCRASGASILGAKSAESAACFLYVYKNVFTLPWNE